MFGQPQPLPKPPPAVRRPHATAPGLSALQLGVPGGTLVLVKLVLTAAVTVDTPVALSTDDPTATLPGTVLVPAGQSFARFAVQTKSPTARRFLTIRATLAGVTRLQQITLEPATTPAPVPVPAAITGYQSAAGAPLTSAKPGDTITVLGTGFTTPLPPTFGRLIINDGDAKVLTWTDTRITAVVQPVAAGLDPVRLYLQAGNSGAPQPLVMVAPPIPITSGSQSATISGLFAADGATPLAHALPGASFVIRGSGLGTVAGQVAFDPTGPAKIGQWTATQISGTVPDPGDGPRVHETVQVTLPGATTFLTAAADFTIDGTPTPPAPGVFVPCRLPLLANFLNAARQLGSGPDWDLAGGQTAFAEGTCFGAAPGQLLLGAAPLPVLAWSDTEIAFTVPAPPPLPALLPVTLTRADGVSVVFRGFSVVPR
jgi:hypothetical protein